MEYYVALFAVYKFLFMKNYYNLEKCQCGFYILLDENNKVRFANTGIGLDILKNIINKELNKDT